MNLTDVTYDLLTEMELDIGEGGALYDADTGSPIVIGGKQILCSIDPAFPVYETTNTRVFTPNGDFYLMRYMMAYYFDRLENDEYESKHILSFSNKIDNKTKQFKAIAVIGTADGLNPIVESDWFWNRSLAMAELILRVAGKNVALFMFDDPAPEDVL